MASYSRAFVRLLLLQALFKAPQYRAHQEALLKTLAEQGSVLSRDDLHIELSWLENADCVVLQITGGVYIATLTFDGEEIAQGIKQLPGVDRPRPGA